MVESEAALWADVAIDAAQKAGDLLLDYWGKAKVEYKGEIDLVTDADRAAERLIIDVILDRFPEHGIFAEESGEQKSHHPVRWIIDPIDGTTNYAHGLPLFAVSIAVAYNDQVVAGVVYNPATKEMYAAKRGAGATLNGSPISVSDIDDINRSLLVTGFPYSVRETKHHNFDHFTNFTKISQGVRRLGSAALDLAFVARGALEGYWENSINPWDYAAGWLLVEEAGGRVTDLKGNPLSLDRRQLLATNGRVHQAMLDTLEKGETGF